MLTREQMVERLAEMMTSRDDAFDDTRESTWQKLLVAYLLDDFNIM